MKPGAENTAKPTADSLRVLVASHSHPEITKGGAEIAAFNLYRDLNAHGDTAWFLGCDRKQALSHIGAPITQPFSESEFLYAAGEYDWIRFANRDPNFPQAFDELLLALKPDIVHFHHYISFGVEALERVKRVLPKAKVLLTLHEYLAICHHFGQMVTKPDRMLCSASSPLRCNACFPELQTSDFFLRKLYIERFFDCVDRFISPSEFLAKRYASWGISPDRMSIVENLVPDGRTPPSAAHSKHEGLVVGFFGQLSFLKGVSVLLDAADMLKDEAGVQFQFFGDYRNQPPEFQKELTERMASAGSNVRFNGPYDGDEVDTLMQSVDVTVVPSVWWENSPLVIQEAFRNKVPVICSNIGGMAEKVRDGLDGFHFRAGSAAELAALLRRLLSDPAQLKQMRKSIQAPLAREAIRDAHLALYREALRS